MRKTADACQSYIKIKHKALTKRAKQQQQQQQSTAFSTLATNKNDDYAIHEEQVVANSMVDNDSMIILKKETSKSVVASYGQSVEHLFFKKSKIDCFWKEPLLLVTKPSARNMVLQLNPAVCPMGYDPTAAPNGSLKTTTEPTAGKRGSLLAYIREKQTMVSRLYHSYTSRRLL